MAKQYPHIFGHVPSSSHFGKTHTLSVIQLIPLQEVFVQALSRPAYSRAKADLPSFENWLCQGQRILRQDSIYTLNAQDGPDPGLLTYKLIMTEPVLQGYAQKSHTLFTLLPPAEEPPAINGHQTLPPPSLPYDAQIESDDDDEGLEIGESFLASSLIPQPSYPQQGDSPTIRVSQFAHEFTARALSLPTYSELDDYKMYVRTVDLPKVGVLDGDWVSAKPLRCGNEDASKRCQAIVQPPSSRSRRIVRLEANDEVVGDPCDPYPS
jgi:peroxin-6